MKFFGKQSEYEIMGQTYIEIMGALNSKSTIEIEKIVEIDGYNVYFLSIIYAIIESGIIKSRFQLSKIKCSIFDTTDLVNHIYDSDFYKKDLYYSQDDNTQFIEEISKFIYENLLLYYDRFLENNKDYIPNDVEKNKRIELIKKGVEKSFKNPLPSDAILYVCNLSESFYNNLRFREDKSMKDLVIKYLENIYQK